MKLDNCCSVARVLKYSAGFTRIRGVKDPMREAVAPPASK